jgi:hypothetical protein
MRKQHEVKQKETVTYRPGPELARWLRAEAPKRGTSVDQLARSLAERGRDMEALSQKLDEVAAQLVSLKQELRQVRAEQQRAQAQHEGFRKDMTTLYGALLYRAGKATLEEAEAWLKKKGLHSQP